MAQTKDRATPDAEAYDPSALEFQSKVITEHTQNTGLYFGKFCSGFASYSRKLGALRDQGDQLARAFSQYSETQAHCSSTKKHLVEFSSLIAGVQDHMHARILRIEAKVVAGFSKYGVMSRVIKDEVAKGASIREKEHRHMEELQKMHVRHSSQGDTISFAQIRQQTDTAKLAASDAKKAHEILLKEADRFEQQKLEDLRRVLMNYCEIELAFHAKVMKLYSQAYNVVKKLDGLEDIETFRNQMHILQGSSSVVPDPNLVLRWENGNASSSDSDEDIVPARRRAPCIINRTRLNGSGGCRLKPQRPD